MLALRWRGPAGTHAHYEELGSPSARVVISRMLEQLTYVQIGDRLNISPEGARAIAAIACRARTTGMARPWLLLILITCNTNLCPHDPHAACR
jgi:hypothetical protein